ncbi:hypothetical protein PPYR_01338 [Photinus pyralis]|uniref:DUF4218 domain-containing protein n=1 Tax=Photinus pyralis TaxID=7054 RepID=A0A5N4B4A8_PHOPY|nr:hypothetical protein PPYR_01338 [Photinus pyralis]
MDSIKYLKNYVIMVGVFHGNSKPDSANEFLRDFIEDSTNLITNGIFLGNNSYNFRVKMLVCDAPAKSFVLNVKGHTAENGCTKCYQGGKRINNVMCFPWMEQATLRTDAEFREQYDNNHHQGTTLLTELPKFDIIKDVPLDYMHLVCLGIMKRLLTHKRFGWISGNYLHKLSLQQQNEISNNLIYCKKFIVCEFSNRKCRSLHYCARFKAVEFRLLLLYSGPIMFKKYIKQDHYCHFLHFHVAMRILNNDEYCQNKYLLDYAQNLLNGFVKDSERIYGPDFISFNVHNLLHLVQDVVRFGAVHNFSAFDFENHMRLVKKMVRKHDKPLQQVVNRMSEQISCKMLKNNYDLNQPTFLQEHSKGPLLNNCCSRQYMILKFKGYTFKLNSTDCYAILNDNKIIKIHNFVTVDNLNYAVVQYLQKVGLLFNSPCESELVGICCITISNVYDLKICNINEIKSKVMILPKKNNEYVAYSLLH